jgi:P4 family phage/plasmid primase-like protien
MTVKQTISEKKPRSDFESPFVEFFEDYKISEIDNAIFFGKFIEIRYDELPQDIKTIYDKVAEPEKLILEAIQETFKKRCEKESGDSVGYDQAIKNNRFKIKIIQYDENPISIDGKSNEMLKNKDDENIDVVADNLSRKYQFKNQREGNQLLGFNGKIYDNEFAELIIEEETEKRIEHCKEYQTREVISKIKRKNGISYNSFDKNPEVITINNGILNIMTGEKRNHSPNHYSKILFPVDYKEPEFQDIEDNLKDTLFWKYLTNSFTVDGKFRKDDFDTVLEIMASFLIRKSIDDRAFLFLGKGKNGKSTLIEYLETMIGTKNVSHTPLQDLADDKSFLAELQDKVANMFGDIESDELKHTGKLKELITNKPITVRKLYGRPFELHYKGKLLFAMNLFPQVKDQSNGFFRRWIIVNWDRSFSNDKANEPNLKEMLCENKEEMNLVFSCLVGIAKKLLINGKFTHTKDEKEVKKIWLENSNPLEAWIRNYTKNSVNSTSLREAHDFYKQIMYEKGETPVSMHKLNQAIEEEYEKSKSHSPRAWLNMELKIERDSKMEDHDNT